MVKQVPSRGYNVLIESVVIDEMMRNVHFDIIVRCLEYVRLNIDKIYPNLIDFCEFDLITLITPHNQGQGYPVLGLHCKDETRSCEIPYHEDVSNEIDNYINQITIEKIIEFSRGFDYVDWKKLETLGTFPKR